MLKYRITVVLLFVILFVLVLSVTAFAEENVTPTAITIKAFTVTTEGAIEVPNFTGLRPGDTIKVKVELNNVSELKGMDMILEYDPSILEVQIDPTSEMLSLTPAISFTALADPGTINISTGTISFSGTDATGKDYTAETEILSMDFKVKQVEKGAAYIWFRKGDGIVFINNQNIKFYPIDITYSIFPIQGETQGETPLELAQFLVQRAEASHLQQDVNTAVAAVVGLEDNEIKSGLIARLGTVQSIITNIDAAFKAIAQLPQPANISLDDRTAVENARRLADIVKNAHTPEVGIPHAYEADILNLDKLVACESRILYLKAKAAVLLAESTKLQSDVNTAKDLVKDLPNGNTKNGFNTRLEDVQKSIYISNAINAIEGLPGITDITLTHKPNVVSARNLVKMAKDAGALDTDITNLQKLVDCEEKIQVLEAEAAVLQAETSKIQQDVDSAKALVEALPNRSEKNELIERLNVVQKLIYIANAISIIESLPQAAAIALTDKPVVENARNLVKTAKDAGALDTDITNLQKLMDCENKIHVLEAEEAVLQAETSKTQQDVNAAKALVDSLPNGPVKTDFTNRLNAVQKAICITDAINAINSLPEPAALTKGYKAAVSTARSLVNTAKSKGAEDSQITNLQKLIDCEAKMDELERQPQQSGPTFFIPPVIQTGPAFEVVENHVKFTQTMVTGDNAILNMLSINDIKEILKKIPAKKDGSEEIIFDFADEKGKRSYELQLPAEFLQKYQGRTYEINTPIGSITLKGDLLKDAGKADYARLAISPADKIGIGLNIMNQIKDRPFVELKAYMDDKPYEWSKTGESIAVSIPYTPKPDEQKDLEHITILDIDSKGSAKQIRSAKYDTKSGKITFLTDHLSIYAAVFVKKTFDDLKSVEWARDSVEILASKDIISGKTTSKYDPISPITRGDFAVYLVNTLGVTAEFDSNFDDVKKDMYCYEAVGILKKLGIASGGGNNKFSSDKKISRQDIMVLIAKALKVTGNIKTEGNVDDLKAYTDASKFSSYALESAAVLVKEGIFSGTGNNRINPLIDTTRAQAAIILYRIFTKYC